MERERNLPRMCLLFIVSYFVFCFINKEVSAAVCTAEEGKPHNLTCTNPNKDKNVGSEVIWKRSITGNINETVAICRKSGCDINGKNDHFFDASLVNGTSTLTIKNVSRFEPFNMTTNWTCWWGRWWVSRHPKTVCEPLHVVVQPEKPTCTATLRQDTVNVICTTQRVYPPAKCHFCAGLWSEDCFRYRTTNESYNHTMLDIGRYYRSECQLTIENNQRGPWRRYEFEDPFSFFVRMYPGWSSGTSYSQRSQTWRIERVLRSDETTTTTTTQQPLPEAATMASSVEGDATEPGGHSPGTVISLAVLLFIMTAVAITLGILMYLVRRGRRQPKTLPPPSPPMTQPQPPQLPQPPQQNYDGMEMAQKDDAEGHVYEGVNPRDTDAGFEEDGLGDKSTYGNVKMSESTKKDGLTDKSTYGNVKTSQKSNK